MRMQEESVRDAYARALWTLPWASIGVDLPSDKRCPDVERMADTIRKGGDLGGVLEMFEREIGIHETCGNMRKALVLREFFAGMVDVIEVVKNA